MKKRLIGALFAIVAVMGFMPAVSAQDMTLPVDPEVRIGRLDNGLTYYIRHNEKPKGQADFYIAQKVGSILENDNQRGLAHFLEHMCFNGTTNFPGNSLISWLETIGVKFGQNLNAYTSVDETVYNISNVPVARESVQDSCLLILHDWANNLLLEDEEIDKERGVIHQEWRRSMVGQMRILEKLLPTMYPGSKYGERLPIGTMEVVDNFPYQALRDYYEAWYRPDQQAIIVVGDIDVDRIEGKIREMFADIEMPADAPERVYEPVPDTEGTIYAIGADKEQTVAIVELMFKTEPVPDAMKNTIPYLVTDYVVDMATTMLNNRFEEMMANPDVNFAQAGTYYGNFILAKTADALTLVGVAKDNDLYPVLETIYRELLRASRGGFTVSEYERARDEYLSRLETIYNNRESRENGQYVGEYVKNFTDNEPIPGLETEYQLLSMIANNIPVEAINQFLPELIQDDNRVLLAMLPEKEGFELPTADGFASIIAKVDAEDIEPYKEEVKSEPLIGKLPKPGKIKAEKELPQWGATELTLSNGVKVIVKHTDFKADQILFEAFALGGTSAIDDSKTNELHMLDDALSTASLGTYTNSDLSKYLSGKQASVSLSFDDYTREISGSTTPKDLPTLMELIYAYFTELGIDPAEYSALQNRLAGLLRNQESNPQIIFSRDLAKALYASPRKQLVTPEQVEAADRGKIVDMAKQLMNNAADYTFYFVGNVDIATLRPLLEQYIATLPANAKKANNKVVDLEGLYSKEGSGTDSFTTKMETPQTWVYFQALADMPYSSKNQKVASIAGQILSNRLLKTVREDMGAVYSIGAQGGLKRLPARQNAMMLSAFPMKPEMKQEVLDFISAELARMQSDITAEELNKAVEFMVKEAIEDKELNSPWLNAMIGTSMNGVDTFNGNVETLQAITIDDIQDFVKQLIAADNLRFVILDPETAE